MRSILAIGIIAMVSLSSCLKQNNKCGYNESSAKASEQEINNLEDSLGKYGISGAQLTPEGFYYKIKNEGTGRSVSNLCSYLTVEYEGKFFDGKVFDSTKTGSPAFFQLGGVIVGWQKAIPLIKAGGEMTIYLPPSLAYGSRDIKDQDGKVILPANSYLVFDVQVKDIQ